jgi:hypothetical protein
MSRQGLQRDRIGTSQALTISALLAIAAASAATSAAAQVPARLADTGLYEDFAERAIAAGVFAYTPQYPLWSDGATKRRFVLLPAGTAIDATDADAWVFPVGTKFWKEFSFARPVETRYMERTAAGWLYATYAWNADGSEALLAAERGVRGAAEIRPGTKHDLPSRWECVACHEGQPTPVLGFGALQLSSDRDALAPHAELPQPGDLDLAALVERGLVRGLPLALVATPPRIAARSPRERAALGYLHANCSHCHNAAGPLAAVGMSLAVRLLAGEGGVAEALTTAVDRPSHYRLPGADASLRVRPGEPEQSLMTLRMASRNPLQQMPPLGTKLVDQKALALIRYWIREQGGADETVIPSSSELSNF